MNFNEQTVVIEALDSHKAGHRFLQVLDTVIEEELCRLEELTDIGVSNAHLIKNHKPTHLSPDAFTLEQQELFGSVYDTEGSKLTVPFQLSFSIPFPPNNQLGVAQAVIRIFIDDISLKLLSELGTYTNSNNDLDFDIELIPFRKSDILEFKLTGYASFFEMKPKDQRFSWESMEI